MLPEYSLPSSLSIAHEPQEGRQLASDDETLLMIVEGGRLRCVASSVDMVNQTLMAVHTQHSSHQSLEPQHPPQLRPLNGELESIPRA